MIGVADVAEDGVGAGSSTDDVGDVEVVEGVGGLEPGAAETKVEMKGIVGRQLEVDAVEDVLFVTLVVEDAELGRVEESSGVKAVKLDEVTPVLAAIAEIDRAGGGAEGSVGGGDGAGGSGDALA